jgi:salicylate hydroxylase
LIAHAGRPGRWALVDRAPLTRWSKGRVTLLGDAARVPCTRRGPPGRSNTAALHCARCIDDPELALDVYQRVSPRAGRIRTAAAARTSITAGWLNSNGGRRTL